MPADNTSTLSGFCQEAKSTPVVAGASDNEKEGLRLNRAKAFLGSMEFIDDMKDDMCSMSRLETSHAACAGK